jgi:hypothetical protein
VKTLSTSSFVQFEKRRQLMTACARHCAAPAVPRPTSCVFGNWLKKDYSC